MPAESADMLNVQQSLGSFRIEADGRQEEVAHALGKEGFPTTTALTKRRQRFGIR